jgi:DedD protein
MDPNIKNRLVGVIVIFALAVIFLPMILDGSGMRKDEHGVVIPPQPLVNANPEFESEIIELQSKVDALPELESRLVDESSVPEDEQPKAAEPASVAKVPAEEARETTESGSPTGGDSWVLQVGSFQDRDKALAQRDKLRKSNIAAVFIERFEYENKSSYRVRLGPFLNREQTRVAQNKIKAKHDIDGIIMKYER